MLWEFRTDAEEKCNVKAKQISVATSGFFCSCLSLWYLCSDAATRSGKWYNQWENRPLKHSGTNVAQRRAITGASCSVVQMYPTEKKQTCSVAVGNCSFCCLQIIPATALVTNHPDTPGLEHPLWAPSPPSLGLSKGQTFCKIFTTFVFLVVSLSFYLLFSYTDCKWRKRSNMFSSANITADRRANGASSQSWLVNDKPSPGAILVQKCFINKQYDCALYAFCICLCFPCTAVWGLQQSLLQCWAWLSCEGTAQCSRNPQQKWTAHSVNGNQLQNLLFGKIVKSIIGLLM